MLRPAGAIVSFSIGSSMLSPGDREQVARAVGTTARCHFVVTSYTAPGSDNVLRERRVRAVVKEIVADGIEPSRILLNVEDLERIRASYGSLGPQGALYLKGLLEIIMRQRDSVSIDIVLD